MSARADLDWLAELIGDARQAAPSVEWLVVGALARDLHLSYARGIRVDRITTDTDLALTIATWMEFAQVRNALLASASFVADRRVEHKLLHRSGRALDVVPYRRSQSIDRVATFGRSHHERSRLPRGLRWIDRASITA